MTLAGKEEEVEKSEDRTESSGSSTESGDLGSGAFDISKLITINLQFKNIGHIQCFSHISYLFWRFLHWIFVLLSYYAFRFSLLFMDLFYLHLKL